VTDRPSYLPADWDVGLTDDGLQRGLLARFDPMRYVCVKVHDEGADWWRRLGAPPTLTFRCRAMYGGTEYNGLHVVYRIGREHIETATWRFWVLDPVFCSGQDFTRIPSTGSEKDIVDEREPARLESWPDERCPEEVFQTYLRRCQMRSPQRPFKLSTEPAMEGLLRSGLPADRLRAALIATLDYIGEELAFYDDAELAQAVGVVEEVAAVGDAYNVPSQMVAGARATLAARRANLTP
jgi:hypothetical protein